MNQVFVVGDLLLGASTDRAIGWEKEFFKCWQNSIKEEDVVVLVGNTAVDPIEHRNDPSYKSQVGNWFAKIKEQAGQKILLLGHQDQRRPNWYAKFGFATIIPFGDSITFEHDWGKILFSYFPAFVLEGMNTDKFVGVIHRLGKKFDTTSSILNIHSFTGGKTVPRHNTFDCSVDFIGPQLITLDQILHKKFKAQ